MLNSFSECSSNKVELFLPYSSRRSVLFRLDLRACEKLLNGSAIYMPIKSVYKVATFLPEFSMKKGYSP